MQLMGPININVQALEHEKCGKRLRIVMKSDRFSHFTDRLLWAFFFLHFFINFTIILYQKYTYIYD
jgi:hypothetical protein